MFKSAEQAVLYFWYMAYYNRHVGEFVVATLQFLQHGCSFFQ